MKLINPLCLKWTGGIERCENSSKKLTIKISGGNKKQVAINVCTVSELNLPSQSLDYKNLAQRFHHLQNLPIKSYCDAVPKLLIGLNHLTKEKDIPEDTHISISLKFLLKKLPRMADRV